MESRVSRFEEKPRRAWSAAPTNRRFDFQSVRVVSKRCQRVAADPIRLRSSSLILKNVVSPGQLYGHGDSARVKGGRLAETSGPCIRNARSRTRARQARDLERWYKHNVVAKVATE